MKQAALEHALREYPRESCGLAVIIKGRERYLPCRNLGAGMDQFIMDPRDYAAAAEAGDIVAVVHSHPNLPPTPSPADRVACEASGLPWHIVSVPDGQWNLIWPVTYNQPLIGRQYVHGSQDCYTLVRDWYALEGLCLPDFDRSDQWWNAGQDLYVDNFERCGFVEIDPSELDYGDAILMAVSSPVPNHAAVYIGDNRIIHHAHNRLSGREVYGDFWRNLTTHVLRNENHRFTR